MNIGVNCILCKVGKKWVRRGGKDVRKVLGGVEI